MPTAETSTMTEPTEVSNPNPRSGYALPVIGAQKSKTFINFIPIPYSYDPSPKWVEPLPPAPAKKPFKALMIKHRLPAPTTINIPLD
jgi:hypothetical protein